MREKVARQCPQTITFEEKGEPKQIRSVVLLLTSLTPYRQAKPAHHTTFKFNVASRPQRPQGLAITALGTGHRPRVLSSVYNNIGGYAPPVFQQTNLHHGQGEQGGLVAGRSTTV